MNQQGLGRNTVMINVNRFTCWKGICVACGQMIAGSNCKKHLFFCSKMLNYLTKNQYNIMNPENTQNHFTPGYILKIVDFYRPQLYWIYVSAPSNLSLRDLDIYLRAFWLQCCSHMSCFTGNDGKEYFPHLFSNITFPNFENHFLMSNYSIEDFFGNNTTSYYSFDFGDTTKLQITVIEQINNAPKQRFILLIQNEQPNYYCDLCSEQLIITYCDNCEKSFCEKCNQEYHGKAEANKMNCDPQTSCLPIINSPRVGKCGYRGPVIDPSNLIFNVFDPNQKMDERTMQNPIARGRIRNSSSSVTSNSVQTN